MEKVVNRVDFMLCVSDHNKKRMVSKALPAPPPDPNFEPLPVKTAQYSSARAVLVTAQSSN
jgi:hypothetical protein